MPLILARHSAAELVTCPLSVEADAEGLGYSASARQLNFIQMQQQRIRWPNWPDRLQQLRS